ncbi:hypothetical protein ACIBJI_41895 [Nocardia sp. NPDC050408]|uniref:hypothetical protein n=1 Tax=Nocardia sp. NPDC050408 TaxID=3364319 RepID=UPI0037B42CB7
MTREHLCGNPVYAKSIHGRKPMFCEQDVEGPDGIRVRHTGKTAAAARDRLGLKPDDVKRMTAAIESSAAPTVERQERMLAPVPDLPFERTVSDQTQDSISEVQTVDNLECQTSELESESADENVAEQQLSVTDAVDRVEHLVTRYEAIAQLIKTATETLAPEITAALASAAAAGAAEREIIEANKRNSEKLTREVVARKISEEAAAESAKTQRRLAVERDEALAAARKATEDAEEQVAQAHAEVARVKEEAAGQVAEAKAEAEDARRLAHEASESAAAASDQAEEKVNAANAFRAHAEGEVAELRKQVQSLTDQLETREEQHRAAIEKLQEQHRKDVKELHEYYQGIVRDTQQLLRTAYEITGRQPHHSDENASAAAAYENE